jgi:hypothetical protein
MSRGEQTYLVSTGDNGSYRVKPTRVLVARCCGLSFSMLAILFSSVRAQQINIPTIDAMPNLPQPYQMRNWREVAIEYDSLLFNPNFQSWYPPLLTNPAPYNYPSEPAFGLYTAVCPTQYTGESEAINCIPAVVGASPVGIDKTNQFGRDFVQMCDQWFNQNNGQNIYKNGFNDLTNDDF